MSNLFGLNADKNNPNILEPKSYPKLVPEAKKEIGDMYYGGGECKFVNFKGYTYAFTIGMEAGVNRLHWMNLTSGTSGSFSTFLNTIKGKEAIDDDTVLFYTKTTFVGAENIISMHDYAFDVIAHTGHMECIQVVACCTSQFENVTVKWEDGKERTFQSPTDTILYFITLKIDDLGYLEVFQGTYSKLYAYGGWKQENKKIGELSAITSGDTWDASGEGLEFIIAAKEYKVPTSGDDYYERMDVLQYRIKQHFMDELEVGYYFISNTDVSEVPTLETSAKRILPEEGYYDGSVTWYAIEKDSTNRGTLVHGCNEARKVKLNALTDKEENVIFYAKRPNEHTLYYLDQQKIIGEDGAQVGVRNWLKRADVKIVRPIRYVTYSHTITDFDVQVDADSFYLQEYGGLTYIYWLSTVDKTDEDAPDVVFPEEFALLVREVPGLRSAQGEGSSVVALHGAGAFHHIGHKGRDGFLVGQIALFFRCKLGHVNPGRIRFPVPGGLEEVSERPYKGRLAQQFLLGVAQFHFRRHDAPAFGGDGLVVAHQQEPGQFFAGQPAGQVGRTFLRAQPPVLVRVQRAIAVQVFEGLPFNGEDGNAGRRAVAQCRAVFLVHKAELPLILFRPSGTVGQQEGREEEWQYFFHG